MKLLIDMSCITKKTRYSSVSIYIMRLVDSLKKKDHHNIILLFDKSFEFYLKDRYPDFTYYTIKRNYLLYRLPFISDWYARCIYKKTISKIQCDYELIASDLDRGTLINPIHNRVIVIHDLKGIKEKTFASKKNFLFYKKIIETSRAVIAISNYTKNDIILHYKTPENKISVIHNSVNLSHNSIKPDSFDDSKKYFLYVNTLQPYKNILTLLQAFNLLVKKFDYNLVIVGKTTAYWLKIIRPFIQSKFWKNRIIHYEKLSAEELKYLYENTSLFISTSKREGFGYTPIEAAICRVPVLCSMCEALQETTHGLVNYYSPVDDFEALAYKMEQIINKPLQEKELNQIAEFFKITYSDEHQLEQIMQVFQNLENT